MLKQSANSLKYINTFLFSLILYKQKQKLSTLKQLYEKQQYSLTVFPKFASPNNVIMGWWMGIKSLPRCIFSLRTN